MAKCVAPAMSAEARGRVGGIVYNTFRGKSTVKGKVAPAQPRSARQLLVRAIMVQISRAWAANTHHADWNAYAETHTETDWTNSTTRLTGHNWFVRLNSRLALFTAALITSPPTIPAPSPVAGLTATGASGTITVTWSSPTTALPLVELWIQGPITAGRQPSIVKARLQSDNAGNAGSIVISGLLAGTYAIYGRTFDRTTGLVSQFIYATGVVS